MPIETTRHNIEQTLIIARFTDPWTAKYVKFREPPTDVGEGFMAVFEDTCGNLIQLYQSK